MKDKDNCDDFVPFGLMLRRSRSPSDNSLLTENSKLAAWFVKVNMPCNDHDWVINRIFKRTLVHSFIVPTSQLNIFKILHDDKMSLHLQALGIPRYSFRHSLQTQTLAVHMWPGAATFMWASTDRSSAHQQRKNQSQTPAERSTPPQSGRKHYIHLNYFQIGVKWKCEGVWIRCDGSMDPDKGQGMPFDCVVESLKKNDANGNQTSSPKFLLRSWTSQNLFKTLSSHWSIGNKMRMWMWHGHRSKSFRSSVCARHSSRCVKSLHKCLPFTNSTRSSSRLTRTLSKVAMFSSAVTS